MNHCLRLVMLFGIVSLSLLTDITPVEAFGRCRHRCRCQPICSPCASPQPLCMGQVRGVYAGAQQCMYCDGTYWQVATDGQPCVMMPSSSAGTDCTLEQDKKKSPTPPRAIKKIHGRGFQPDPIVNLYVWYSDKDGNDRDGTNLWCCPKEALIDYTFTGKISPNGELYYDITVYVDGQASEKPKGKTPTKRTIHGRSFQPDPIVNLYVWYSDAEGNNHDGTNLWFCPKDALVQDPVVVGQSASGELYYDITVYVEGKPSR